MSDSTAKKTPLIDLLRGVPADAVASYEHSPTHHHHIPYGRLCHEAAAELDALRAENARLRAALEAATKPFPTGSAVEYHRWYTTTRREALDG